MALAGIIGKNIRRARRDLHLSQVDVAQAVGVTPSTVYRWESGRSMPRRDHLEALAATLQVALSDLVREHP